MVSIICKNCGKEFWDYFCHRRRKYCSIECSKTLFKKGSVPWNKDKKGIMPKPWNKGIKSYVKPWLGKKLYPGMVEAIRRSRIGKSSWNKGLKGYMAGKKHYNWQGGKSSEGYAQGWTELLREEIRMRDKRKCQKCGVPEKECLIKLDVHHKDNNKKNNNPDNLVSLCHNCHTKITVREREVYKCKI